MTAAIATRHFLDWTRPALRAAAERLVAAHAGAGVADLRDAVVVVPGGRASRRLTELLLETAEGRGLALLPPRIVTVGSLPDLLVTRANPTASPTVRRLVWARSLAAHDRAALETVFARLPGPDEPLPAWGGLAREVERLAREVGAAGHTFAAVARRCGAGVGGFDDSARWRILAGVQTRYRLGLERLQMDDPDLARTEALDTGEVALPGPVWLVGLAELPGLVARLLRSAAAGDDAPPLHALVHAPATRAEAFDELGLLRTEAWVDTHLPLADEQLSVVEGPGEQASETARIVASRAAGRRPDEVVVGVPAPEVVPYLAERLERGGVGARDAAGLPVTRTGPWRLVEALAEVLAERSQESVAALLRHPDLGPWLERAAGVRPGACLQALDRWTAAHLPARMVAPYPGRDEDSDVVRSVMDALDRELLRELNRLAPLSGHARPLLDALTRIYGVAPPDESTPTGARTARALRVLDETARTLAELPAELDATCDARSALRLILDESSPQRIPERPDRAAVELLGWLELHLDDAAVTVVTGVNEGALPETVRGHPFLPDSLRGHLGLEDNRRRLARDLYRLTAMHHSRPHLNLIAGRRSAAGDPLRPSRLLFATDDPAVARRVRHFYGMDRPDEAEGAGARATDSATTGDARAPAAEASPRGPGAPGIVLPPEGELELDPFPATLSPSDFRGILADPYRWALAWLRGPRGPGWPRLQPVDDDALEMDGAVFGDLAHHVLQRWGEGELRDHRRGAPELDHAVVARRLDELLEEAARERFGSHARVAVRLQLEQLATRLRAFAEWQVEWASAGWRIEAVEVKTPVEGLPLGSTPPVGLKGKIDRIDHHPDHGWVVLDYKTGDRGDDPHQVHLKGGRRGARGADTEFRDLQLPLYHYLAPRLTGLGISGAEPEEIDVGYILLPRDLAKTGVNLAGWDADTLAAGVDRARELVAMLAAGPVPFDPDAAVRFDDERLEALLGLGVLGGGADGDDEEVA